MSVLSKFIISPVLYPVPPEVIVKVAETVVGVKMNQPHLIQLYFAVSKADLDKLTALNDEDQSNKTPALVLYKLYQRQCL